MGFSSQFTPHCYTCGINLNIFLGCSKKQGLHIDSDYIKESLEYIKKNNIATICISKCYGYQENDIDFILDHKNITGIEVYDAKGIDISAIENATWLQHLRISEEGPPIDLSKLNHLESLNISWTKRKYVLPSYENGKSLRLLYLWRCKKKTLDFLSHYENLEFLTVTHGSSVSLSGIDRFQKLRYYEHSYGKNLVDISAVAKLPQLEELRFDHCKKIEIDGVLEQCQSVKRLALISCCDVPSLSFLRKMKYIEDFRFGSTNILDGDLTPLLQLKDFAFYPNKRSYSHTEEELKKIRAEMQ